MAVAGSLPDRWYRIHRSDRSALWFGTEPRGRFNAPDGGFGVLYAAADPAAAFIETYGQSTGIRVVTESALAATRLCEVLVAAPIALVDLTGAGLARLGADARLCTGEHALAQRWSRALWAHPAKPDGLLYRARHDQDRICVAFFSERGCMSATATQLGSLLAQLQLLGTILDRYGFGLVAE